MNALNKKYLNWIEKIVCDRKIVGGLSYDKLLSFLHELDFTYVLDRDGNRYEDGIGLRYRFGYENGIPQVEISSELDNRPCSVLEMMVALALRCEEDVMNDPDVGDRTGQWFWIMIDNLGLTGMTDSKIDYDKIKFIISRLLKREYGRNGTGGLFPNPNQRKDMRSVEIWYQAMWYLNEIA